MFRSRLTTLACLAVGISFDGIGIASDGEPTAPKNEGGPAWVLVPDDTFLPARPSHRSQVRQNRVSEPIAQQDDVGPTANDAVEQRLVKKPHPLWELSSDESATTPVFSPPVANTAAENFDFVPLSGMEPALTDSTDSEDNGAHSLWDLCVDDLNQVPMLGVNTSHFTNSSVDFLKLDETSIQTVSGARSNQELAAPGTELVVLSAQPDPVNVGEGEMAIPMIEPLDLRSIRVAALQNNRTINVIRFQQEEVATEIDTQIAKFDPTLGLGIFGGQSNRQNRSIIQAFGTNTTVQNSFFLNPYGQNQIYLQQRNYLGGLATLGFTSQYLSLDPAGTGVFVNPGFDSRLRFNYKQPLLKGFGNEVNRAPIYIAARKADQASFAFQASVQQLMRDVELAYWDWDLAYGLQQLLEQDEERSRTTWEREAEKLRIGTGTVAAEAESRERYHRSRLRLVQGVSLTTIGELKLRQIAGLPAIHGLAFVPAESATEKRHHDDLHIAICNSIHRPEVLAQQAAIAAANAEIAIAQNGLKPDLSLILDYSLLGLEERFDDSLSTLGDFNYYEWTVGVQYSQPLYWRAERAGIRKAQWAAARQRAILDQVHHLISHEIASSYELIQFTAEQLEVHEDRIEAAKVEIEARTELYKNGQGMIQDVLDSQDRLLQAQTDYRVTLAEHQKAISNLNYASGMILEDQIIIAGDEMMIPEGDDMFVPEAPAPEETDDAQGTGEKADDDKAESPST